MPICLLYDYVQMPAWWTLIHVQVQDKVTHICCLMCVVHLFRKWIVESQRIPSTIRRHQANVQPIWFYHRSERHCYHTWGVSRWHHRPNIVPCCPQGSQDMFSLLPQFVPKELFKQWMNGNTRPLSPTFWSEDISPPQFAITTSSIILLDPANAGFYVLITTWSNLIAPSVEVLHVFKHETWS